MLLSFLSLNSGAREREREKESPLTVLRQGKSRVILISIWALQPGLDSLMQRRHPSIHRFTTSLRERQFSAVKGRKVMIAEVPRRNATTFLKSCARFSAAGSATLRLYVTANSQTLILPDPNCRPGYVILLVTERWRQSWRIQESVPFRDPARESTKFRV